MSCLPYVGDILIEFGESELVSATRYFNPFSYFEKNIILLLKSLFVCCTDSQHMLSKGNINFK